ncbi:MarR family winged helix-turn-helix transcriptional regulator [Altererythrobacter sp.]|uniref:MarR family winged helix-turn-helix transcriptional regulator n=1 Tax=Altererythrobacter sp. TaxID=1872480 RepID=UPI003D0748D5
MSDNGSSNGQQGVGRLADFLPYQLSVTSNALSGHIARQYRARFGLKIPEWRVMAVLGDSGAATQRDLAEATLMDKVAVNRACKVLEDRKLIVRQPNSQDGRSHLLELTEEGCNVHREVMPMVRRLEREVFAALDSEDEQRFREILRRISDQVAGLADKYE